MWQQRRRLYGFCVQCFFRSLSLPVSTTVWSDGFASNHNGVIATPAERIGNNGGRTTWTDIRCTVYTHTDIARLPHTPGTWYGTIYTLWLCLSVNPVILNYYRMALKNDGAVEIHVRMRTALGTAFSISHQFLSLNAIVPLASSPSGQAAIFAFNLPRSYENAEWRVWRAVNSFQRTAQMECQK